MNRSELKASIITCLSETAGLSEGAVAENIVHFMEHQSGLLDLTELNNVQRDNLSEPEVRTLDVPLVIQAYFDGNGNREQGGLAQGRIYFPDGEILPLSESHTGKTNNELEYLGLINILKQLLAPKALGQSVTIMGDSKLVVEQTNGRWKVNEKHLVPLRDLAMHLLSQVRKVYTSVELKWIPSAENLVDAHK